MRSPIIDSKASLSETEADFLLHLGLLEELAWVFNAAELGLDISLLSPSFSRSSTEGSVCRHPKQQDVPEYKTMIYFI